MLGRTGKPTRRESPPCAQALEMAGLSRMSSARKTLLLHAPQAPGRNLDSQMGMGERS